MKKLLTLCFAIVFAIAMQASINDNTKALSDRINVSSYHFLDTVPKDTTKKDTMFSSVFAYRIAMILYSATPPIKVALIRRLLSTDNLKVKQ